MTIANSSVLVDGTVAFSAGTATTVKELGRDLGQLNTYLDDGAAFAARTEIQFSTKEPKVSANSPGGYTQARSTARLLKPKTLASGRRTVNSARLELSVDPETTAAEIESLLVLIAQLAKDSDFADFWKKQSVA